MEGEIYRTSPCFSRGSGRSVENPRSETELVSTTMKGIKDYSHMIVIKLPLYTPLFLDENLEEN